MGGPDIVEYELSSFDNNDLQSKSKAEADGNDGGANEVR